MGFRVSGIGKLFLKSVEKGAAMTRLWLNNGEIRYSCNHCGQHLQQSMDEVLIPGIVYDFMIKHGKEVEVHFCNKQHRNEYFYGKETSSEEVDK